MLSLPENFEAFEYGDEKMRIRIQVEKSIVFLTYETEAKTTNPVLRDILHMSQGRTRRDTIKFSANTWDGDIIPFRQCLIRIAR